MNSFEDVPLPGLDLAIEPQQMLTTTPRKYSSTIAPTAAAIDNFWSHFVQTPSCALWVGAIAGGSGYGKNRAKLHLVDYSTSL